MKLTEVALWELEYLYKTPVANVIKLFTALSYELSK
jgi:hypothetical protein